MFQEWLVISTLQGHADNIRSLSFISDDELVSGSDGKYSNMRVWSKSDTRSEWTADNITSKELKAHK